MSNFSIKMQAELFRSSTIYLVSWIGMKNITRIFMLSYKMSKSGVVIQNVNQHVSTHFRMGVVIRKITSIKAFKEFKYSNNLK